MQTDDDFERFYLGSRRRLVGLLYTVTGDLHEAEDITQEAFARAAADWSRISGYDIPEAWVRRVAFNLAANRRRRLVRHAAALLRLGRPADVEPRGVEDVALVDALRTLPVRQRQAVVMHHVAGLEVTQIAAELGVPAGTVKSWLSRGRTALAKALTEDDDAALTEVGTTNA
jgi:RNA polymerase sigma-70 factor (ECF subfamily)